MDPADNADILDVTDSGPEAPMTFPGSVMSRIEELMGSTEQFDNAEFDAVAYINRVFPTEQSLSGVESAVARCEFRLAGVEADIRRLVRAQPEQRERGQEALLQARTCIAELALQVADINKKAERSESMVREITSEIKQLDCAKSNLTAAITTLNHFHMLAGGVASLRAMTQQRRYREIALPLQAIMEVLQHFECYREIRELNELRDQVHETRQLLAQQILQDFKEAFGATRGAGGGAGRGAGPARELRDACGVLDVLHHKHKDELLDWFIQLQLQEYKHLFSADQECAWLAHVERRYAWLKKHLLALEQALASVFPPAWRLGELLAQQFCQMTRSELGAMMAGRADELDVKLLLYAIQKTYNFELLLHKRFVGTDLEGTEPARAGDAQEPAAPEGEVVVGGAAGSPWIGRIGSCFEPHLSLYISSLDANLRALMDRFIQDAKLEPAEATGGVAPAGAVMASCADLFLFYKKCLVQCARLTTHQPMLELAGVFQKYLREYAGAVLRAALPRAPPPAPLHALLRDATHTRYSKQELGRITSVITTAEYCLETTAHLERKLREKVAPALADKVDLTAEQDLFHKMISNCIQLLVQDLELACEPALQAMTKISWLHFDTVGDQSSYITQIVMHLKNSIPNLRDNLSSSRKYFTQFCIRFANSFIPQFIQNIYKCKPISTVGAEQLLLDAHMLKTALLELPSLGSEVRRPAPATYCKVVIKLMRKAEMVLKLVMGPLEEVEGFVGQFVQLLPEGTLGELLKVLEMKGARLVKAQRAAVEGAFKLARGGVA